MSEFDGLSKHPNNPARTESVRSLQRVEAEHYTEQAEEEEEKKKSCWLAPPQQIPSF